MLICNYGLYWKRENIFWGKGNNAGHLNGVMAKNVTGNVVNFREQQGVYVLYDNSFKLIYVGQAGANDHQRLFQRLKQHKRDALADRWSKFSWFGLRWVKVDGDLSEEVRNARPSLMGEILNHIEAIVISSSEPPLNRQGGRFGEDVEQYLQVRDKNILGPTSDEILLDIWNMMKEIKISKSTQKPKANNTI